MKGRTYIKRLPATIIRKVIQEYAQRHRLNLDVLYPDLFELYTHGKIGFRFGHHNFTTERLKRF